MALYPGDVAAGNTGHVGDHNEMRDDIQRMMGRPSTGRAYDWSVRLDDPNFTGSTDDAKLASAMSYAGAQTNKPYIQCGTRVVTLTTPLGQPYDGFGLVGAARGWANVEKGTGFRRSSLVLNLGANSFLDMAAGDSWNWHVEGFQITGNSTTTFITGSGGGTLWASTFRNITAQGLKGMFGNTANKLLVDLITVDGQWELLNFTDTYVNVGGGDVRGFFSDGGNFGCGSSTPPSTAAPQMIFGGYSKGNIGGSAGLYITADNGWRGLKITGSQSSGYGFDVLWPIMEGRNNGSACDGTLINITGGSVNIFGGCVNDGMVNPTASEHGLIEVSGTGTELSVFGTSFAHASGAVNQTTLAGTLFAIGTPCIYASGSANQVSVGAHALKRGFRTGNLSWGTQRPVVQQAVTGLVLASDGFCDVRTAA